MNVVCPSTPKDNVRANASSDVISGADTRITRAEREKNASAVESSTTIITKYNITKIIDIDRIGSNTTKDHVITSATLDCVCISVASVTGGNRRDDPSVTESGVAVIT